MILFIKHIDIEGPETIGEFFQRNGFASTVIDLSRGDCLPRDLNSLDAVVCLGGPMNVDEEEKYPFLKPENEFIKEIIHQEIPYLGICLGSQLLAKASGARVTKAPVEEIGWYKVQLTPQGKADPLFQGLPERFEVFQWHGDTFEIPEGGVHLAESPICTNQAFRYGSNIYGLQFHIEVTPEMILEWLNVRENQKEIASLDKINPENIKTEIPKFIGRLTSLAVDIFQEFLVQQQSVHSTQLDQI